MTMQALAIAAILCLGLVVMLMLRVRAKRNDKRRSRTGAATPQSCLEEFVAAVLRRDTLAALALLTDDVVLFYSNRTAIRGKEAFASNMTAAWNTISDYTYKTIETKWVVQSDTEAAVIYTLAWSGKVNGKDVGGDGRGTRVLQRDDSGWRIAHEHLSSGAWK